MDEPGAQRHQEGEEDAAGPRVGRGLGVRDHEEGEQEERSVRDLVEGDRHRLSQPERAAEQDRQVEGEEGPGHVAARGAVDHEATQAGHQEREEGDAPPLARRDPDAAGQEHQGDDAEVRRVEHVLAVPAEDELAGDGDGRGQAGQEERARPQQQTEREAGDESAARVEGGQPPEPGADGLGEQDRPQEDHRLERRDREVEAQDAIDQQAREHRDLVQPRIAEPEATGCYFKTTGRRELHPGPPSAPLDTGGPENETEV